MKVVIVKDMLELSQVLAVEFMQDISQPEASIGLPGGSTPIGMYQLVAPLIKNNPHLSSVHYFNLDEVMNDEGSIRSNLTFLEDHFYRPCNIPRTQRTDLVMENAESFEALIEEKGGLDSIYLGVGVDGHIAGITPGIPFSNETYVGENTPHFKELLADTFGGIGKVPEHVVTAGPKTLMRAKKIVIMLSGAGKAEIVKQAFYGAVTEEIPASILQMHPNALLVMDQAAASLL